MRTSNLVQYCPLYYLVLIFHSSSHIRLEKKLNLLIAEVRAGKREGSVLSTQTFDTTARNDQETWEALRRELEDIGISPAIITEKRQFIIAWFQEAVAAGKLEEDVASDENGSATSLQEAESRISTSDDDSISSEKISSMMIGPKSTKSRATPIAGPSVSRRSRQTANRSSLSPPQKKKKSRIRVTYLINKLSGRDEQFLRAARDGDVSTVAKLLDKGVNIQTRVPRTNGKVTALHLASAKGKKTTVQFLLSQGADVHAKDRYDYTALHYAAVYDHKQIVKLLSEQGADIEAKHELGRTALLVAAQKGHQVTVLALLEQGADIESKDLHGSTALLHAGRWGYEDTVRLLLEQGADIEAKDSHGWTALLQAALQGHQDTVRLLLDKGANPSARNNLQISALGLALKHDHKNTERLLRDAGASF